MMWMCVIGGSRSHVPFIEACLVRGFDTLVIDVDPAAAGRSIATEFVEMSTHNTAGVIAHLEAGGYDLAGCFTYSSYEAALRTTATVVERFDLRGLRLPALERMWSKPDMLRALAAANRPTTTWLVTADPEEASSILADHGRAVVKPSRGGVGSAGVTVLDRGTDVGAAVRSAVEGSSDGMALIETFIDGPEYSVDGFVNDGSTVVLAVSHKHTLGDGPLMEGFSSVADPDLVDQLAGLASDVVAAAGLDHCYFSLDVISGDELFVIDVGPLLDAKVDRMLHHAGVDVYGVAPDVAAGNAGQRSASTASALRFLYADGDGVLGTAIEGPIDVPHGTGALEFEREAGDSVGVPRSVGDIIGWVAAAGADGAELWADLVALDLSGRFEVAR
jgi:hypothetical protein